MIGDGLRRPVVARSPRMRPHHLREDRPVGRAEMFALRRLTALVPSLFNPLSGGAPALLQALRTQLVPSAAITLNQMHRNGPPKRRPPKLGATSGRPQIKGVVLKTFIKKPKKPNSANRKCAKVRLSNGKEVIVFIPGEGHNLQEHNIVLVEGGRTQDLPGLQLKVVRGKFDCAHVQKKKN